MKEPNPILTIEPKKRGRPKQNKLPVLRAISPVPSLVQQNDTNSRQFVEPNNSGSVPNFNGTLGKLYVIWLQSRARRDFCLQELSRET